MFVYYSRPVEMIIRFEFNFNLICINIKRTLFVSVQEERMIIQLVCKMEADAWKLM